MLRPTLDPRARELLGLARSDRAAATRAMGLLSVEDQVALICAAPMSRRAELLDLVPAPEETIPALPEAELCFTVKEVGPADAGWILEQATPEQITTCVDLDAWVGSTPDRAKLDEWIEAFAEAGAGALLRALRSLDLELVAVWLRDRIVAAMKPSRDDDDWEPPPKSQTLDGQFYFAALREGDDLASTTQMLRLLFEREYWTYFRLLQAVLWESDADNEEWALRWRTGRLQDLGFPTWDEAMRIYRFRAPERLGRLDSSARPLAVGEWHLPVWIAPLAATGDADQTLFRAISQLDAAGRRACFYAIVALANLVAVADRFDLADRESMPRSIEKVARFASLGLEYVAEHNDLSPAEVLRSATLEQLFNVGANLDPEAARPRPAAEDPEAEDPEHGAGPEDD